MKSLKPENSSKNNLIATFIISGNEFDAPIMLTARHFTFPTTYICLFVNCKSINSIVNPKPSNRKLILWP